MATGNVFALLAEEIAQAKASIVVLSAESLSFIRHPETLRQALAPHPARIVIYLRRQDSYLASLYNQLVKSRLFTATFDEFLRQHPENAIDYDRLLKLWASAFGRENILAGVFEDYALPTGILNDIAAKAGIDITGLQPPAADTNPALLHSIVALKRRVNALLSSEDERVCCERLFTANNISAEKAPTDEDISNNVARRRSMLAGYQEGNARVAKEYFAGRPKLFEDPGERDSLLPDYGETDWQEARHQAAVRMIAGLVAELAKKEDVQ